MKTYYFSLIARNAKRSLEVRRCIAIEATHYDTAEIELIEQHLYMAINPDWVIETITITQKHYETMCGILEVAA